MQEHEINIAKQPILDCRSEVWGYELLFRDPARKISPVEEPERASSNVIETSIFTMGLDVLTGGKLAFLNFPRSMLVNHAWEVLPPDKVVVEVLETVEPDDEVLAACRALKAAGYSIALDDFVYKAELEPLIVLADIIKVDILLSSRAMRADWLGEIKGRATLLAEKVETRQEFEETEEEGFKYFQGYFFCKPKLIAQKTVPSSKIGYLRLLKQLAPADLDFRSIERVLKQDMSLSYKLLRYLNSAAFYRREEITSLRHALAMLGEEAFRRWAMIVMLAQISLSEPPELMSVGMTRARMCELLGEDIPGGGSQGANLFFVGLFSILDAALGVTMEVALESLEIVPEVRAALLGDGGLCRSVLELVLAYERAEWDAVDRLSETLNVPGPLVSVAYSGAVQWARGALGGGAA